MPTPRRLASTQPDFESRLAALLAFESAQNPQVEAAVADILADVKRRGDAAVLDYTRRFDRLEADSMHALEVSPERLQGALERLPTTQRDALEHAAERIRAFHRRQLQDSWSYREADGTELGQRVTPLDRVGLYVPGGRAAYPSSVLMNAIPAKVAGVAEVIMVVPTPGGERNELVLAAAALCGVDRVYTIGGAQAIGALAYGTRSVPQVDKIVGPGNAYVAAAAGVVGIDMVAGPSEILVICDGDTNPDWVAMDLFAGLSTTSSLQVILLSQDAGFIDAVAASCERLPPSRPAPTSSGPPSKTAARSSTCARWPRRARSPIASPPSISSCRSPIRRRCCP